ncbi:hypothetical protein ACKWTF_015632 [Chironomus riparius]
MKSEIASKVRNCQHNFAEKFFTPIKLENENNSKFVKKLDIFKAQILAEKFNLLIENNVIENNKRALFDVQKYNLIKNEKIFEQFDEIKAEDFKIMNKSNYDKIIEKLSSGDRQLLMKRENEFAVNYQSLCIIESDPSCNIFGDDEVYKDACLNVIKAKFQNRLADEVIHLEVKPHTELLCIIRNPQSHLKFLTLPLNNTKNHF